MTGGHEHDHPGDLSGTQQAAPHTDRGTLGRMGPFANRQEAGIAAIGYARNELPLEDPQQLFTQAAKQAAKDRANLMIISGGHIPDVAMSGLLITNRLHRITEGPGEDYVYITTAEELVDTMRSDAEKGVLASDSVFHLLQAVTQEVGTAQQFSTMATRKPAAAAFRPLIERGLWTGKSMQRLLAILEDEGIPTARGDNDEETAKLLAALQASVQHIEDDLFKLDNVLN